MTTGISPYYYLETFCWIYQLSNWDR